MLWQPLTLLNFDTDLLLIQEFDMKSFEKKWPDKYILDIHT